MNTSQNNEERHQKDLFLIVSFIYRSEHCDDIIEWLIQGPPVDEGFMWCKYDTPAKIALQNVVADMGYDSSAFGWMMRCVQREIRLDNSTKKTLKQVYTETQQQFPHAIVFVHIGKFYELFEQSAKTIVEMIPELRLNSNKIEPTTGFPTEQLQHYRNIIEDKGYLTKVIEKDFNNNYKCNESANI